MPSSEMFLPTYIAESWPLGFGRAIVGYLRRLEAHEAFIVVTMRALELGTLVVVGGEMGAKRIARVVDRRFGGGLDRSSAK